MIITLLILVVITAVICSASLLVSRSQIKQLEHFQIRFEERNQNQLQLQESITNLLNQQQKDQQQQRERFDEHQMKSLKLIQDSAHKKRHRKAA